MPIAAHTCSTMAKGHSIRTMAVRKAGYIKPLSLLGSLFLRTSRELSSKGQSIWTYGSAAASLKFKMQQAHGRTGSDAPKSDRLVLCGKPSLPSRANTSGSMVLGRLPKSKDIDKVSAWAVPAETLNVREDIQTEEFGMHGRLEPLFRCGDGTPCGCKAHLLSGRLVSAFTPLQRRGLKTRASSRYG